MKNINDLEHSIENLRSTTSPTTDQRILTDASAALAQSTQTYSDSKQTSLRRTIMKKHWPKFAAAAVIIVAGLGVLVLLSNGQATLYAQVIEATENARTIHVIGKDLQNGQLKKGIEVWYQRGAGVVESRWENGIETLREIDNGKYAWQYFVGNELATRSKSIDPLGVVARILDTKSFKQRLKRDTARDKTFDGIRLSAYSSTNPKATWGMTAWLDELDRIRSWEKRHLLDNGQWEKYRIGQVEYDVEIQANIFTLDPDVKVVEVDTILEDIFDLEKATFKEEVLGLVFAVHEVKRCEGGIIYLVSSVRPTDETRQKIRPRKARPSYGDFQLRAKLLGPAAQDQPYQTVDLGTVRHADLYAEWNLFLPREFASEEPTNCELLIYIYTRGNLQKKIKAEGLPWHTRLKPEIALAARQKATLQSVLGEVYSTARALEPFTGVWLGIKPLRYTDKEREAYVEELRSRHYPPDKIRDMLTGKERCPVLARSRKPSEISKEKWGQDRKEYLEEIQNK
ncbi:MAG: hypothetical protein KAT11_00835 [Phycisphaerae bacterium]|nr:hypothetical protein [Phycisphaerae bacterium]